MSERCIAEQKNKNFEENCMKNGHYSGMTTRKVTESAAEQRALFQLLPINLTSAFKK